MICSRVQLFIMICSQRVRKSKASNDKGILSGVWVVWACVSDPNEFKIYFKGQLVNSKQCNQFSWPTVPQIVKTFKCIMYSAVSTVDAKSNDNDVLFHSGPWVCIPVKERQVSETIDCQKLKQMQDRIHLLFNRRNMIPACVSYSNTAIVSSITRKLANYESFLTVSLNNSPVTKLTIFLHSKITLSS